MVPKAGFIIHIVLGMMCFTPVVSQRDVCQGDVASSCPSLCACHTFANQNVHVKCENADLTEIPMTFPEDTSRILIHGNLSSVQAYSFWGCEKLVELQLSNNKITEIHKKAFSGLQSLKFLYLDNNLLNMTEQSVPRNTFDDLVNLVNLNISWNDWRSVTHYRDDLMVPLGKLFNLYMDGIPGRNNWGEGFSYLKSLDMLALTGGLQILTNSSLQVFANTPLRVISISDTPLFDLEPLAFANITNLGKLLFLNNPYIGLSNVSKSFYGLQYTKIYMLKVNGCTRVFNGPYELTDSFFLPLQKTNLTYLLIANNNIGHFRSKFAKYLPKLISLIFINYYVFGMLTFFDEVPKLQNLDILVLTDYAQFGGKHLLSSIEPNNKDIAFQSHDHRIHSSLPVHELRPFPHLRSNLPLLVHFPPNLTSADICLPLNRLLSTLPTIKILGTNKLQSISLCTTEQVTGEFIIEKPIKGFGFTIRMDSSGLTYLNPDFLRVSIRNGLIVEVLSLAKNSLQMQLVSEHENMFTHLKDLKILILSHNKIDKLRPDSFQSLRKLEYLDLRHNALRSIEFNLDGFSNLQMLRLAYNIITYIEAKPRAYFDTRIKEEVFFLDLLGNPLICSCDSLFFLRWLFSTPVTLENFEYYTCHYKGQGEIGLGKIREEYMNHIEKQCASRVFMISISSSFGVMLVVICISVILYRHRWDVKFFCLRLVRKRKLYQEIEDRTAYDYDAFVAYHESNVYWVKHELIPNLEGDAEAAAERAGFKLCVHHRDFLPGTPIVENIVESINKSRKTILVLTKSFVASRWCDYELQMAHTRCFDEGRDIIIVIWLEDVPAASMTSTLQALIKRVTYLKWPQNQAGRPAFWRKLKETMNSQNTRDPVCECGHRVHREERE